MYLIQEQQYEKRQTQEHSLPYWKGGTPLCTYVAFIEYSINTSSYYICILIQESNIMRYKEKYQKKEKIYGYLAIILAVIFFPIVFINYLNSQEYKYETFRLGGYTVYNSILSTTIFSLSQ